MSEGLPPLERTIDARYMAPPEPFEHTLAMLETLAQGESMRLLLFREPHPLFSFLRAQGHRYRCQLEADGTFEILIWR